MQDTTSDSEESSSFEEPEMTVTVRSQGEAYQLLWVKRAPVVSRTWPVGHAALKKAGISFRQDWVSLNPHAMAAAFRFEARSRLKQTVAHAISALSVRYQVDPADYQHYVVALFPSDWEQKVLSFEDSRDDSITTVGCYRDNSYGTDEVRFRALGGDRPSSGLVSVAFDVYALSPKRIFQLFYDHPLATLSGAGRPGARLCVVARVFPTVDGSLYVDTFPTGEDPYLEGYGLVNNGSVEFRASQGKAHDSEYSHSVEDNAWLYTYSTFGGWFPVPRGQNLYMTVDLHREWCVGPYVCVSLSIKHLAGIDERNPSALASSYRAAIREMVRLLGHQNFNILCQQTVPGAQSTVAELLTPAVRKTMEKALTIGLQGALELPLNNVWRESAIRVRRNELCQRLGLEENLAETLAVGAVSSRFEFALSIGGLLKKAAGQLFDKLRDAWEWVKHLLFVKENPAAGSVLSTLVSQFRRLWTKLSLWVPAKLGRLRNLLRAMVWSDWIPWMDHQASVDSSTFTAFVVLVTSAVLEEFVKRKWPIATLVIAAYEFVYWLLASLCQEGLPPLDEVIMIRIATTVMHVTAAFISLPLALTLHVAWNMVSLAMSKAGHRIMLEALKLERHAHFLDPLHDPIQLGTFPAVESPLVFKDALGVEHDAVEVAEQLDQEIDPAPKRFQWFECDLSTKFAQPVPSVASATVVVGKRFGAVIPERQQEWVDLTHDAFTDATKFLQVHWTPLSDDELIQYVKDSDSWNGPRKAVILDAFAKILKGVDVQETRTIFTKTDELLLLKLIDGYWRLKVRPIFPMSLANLREMQAVIPFKRYLSRTWFLNYNSHGRLEYSLEASLHCTGSITYLSDPTPQKKSAWAQFALDTDGVHVLAHGDDEFTMLTRGGFSKAEASDLCSCDLTCHAEFQKRQLQFRIDTCDDPVLAAFMFDRYMSSLKGKFEYQTAQRTGRLEYVKEEESTNTGHPATAQLAFTAQFVTFPLVMKRLGFGGGTSFSHVKLYNEFVKQKSLVYQGYGLDPEPEVSIDHCPQSHSFLASSLMFTNPPRGSPNVSQPVWVSYAYLKSFLFFPDPKKIWGAQGTPGHQAAVYLTDPQIGVDPVSRAFAGFWRRVAAYYGVTDFDAAVGTWLGWLKTQDSHRAEFEAALRKEEPLPPVTDSFFALGIDAYCSGWIDPYEVNKKLSILIDALARCDPAKPVLPSEAIVLLQLRYRSASTELIESDTYNVFGGSAALSILGGIKILLSNTHYFDWMSTPTTKPTKKTKTKPKPKVKKAGKDRYQGWREDFAEQQKFNTKVASQTAKAVLPAMRPSGEAAMRNKALRAPPPRRQLKARLANYLALVSHPFDAEPCKCPVNYNPVPSFLTSVARLTSTFDMTVTANTTSQIALWPGHNLNSDSDAMDGVSYHARLVNIAGAVISVSPVPMASGAPGGWCNGVTTGTIALGGAATNIGAAGSQQISFDQSLPFSGQAGSGDHTRWKLLAMGIRLQNVTPLTNRAGDVTSVQPTNTLILGGGSQRDYSKYPTFRVSEAANTGTLEISWIPAPTDMAFWHNVTTAESPAGTVAEDIGLYVWLNNASALSQQYKIQIVYHYEMAGDSLVAIASPAVLQPSDKNVVEPALDVLRFTSGSAAPFLKVAEAVASGISPFVESAAKSMTAEAMKLLPGIAEAGLSIFG